MAMALHLIEVIAVLCKYNVVINHWCNLQFHGHLIVFHKSFINPLRSISRQVRRKYHLLQQCITCNVTQSWFIFKQMNVLAANFIAIYSWKLSQISEIGPLTQRMNWFINVRMIEWGLNDNG